MALANVPFRRKPVIPFRRGGGLLSPKAAISECLLSRRRWELSRRKLERARCFYEYTP
jgi:hypothetical protein